MRQNSDSAITDLTLVEAARAVQSRQLSPTELVRACLRRIADTNPSLHQYIAVYHEEAQHEALAAERRILAGNATGLLEGVPVAVKDNIGIAGRRTTAGSRILADWCPTEDADVVEQLKAAGAIIIGKTNMHEFAWGGTSANPHYGYVRNPWNADRSPGGSSGGSAVAVAARTCFGALGTDTAGSIRLPAAMTGVVGIRPTIGSVSNRGTIPLAWSMDTIGPMARTVEDCEVIFRALSGGSRESLPARYPTSASGAEESMTVRGVRIGIIPDYFSQGTQRPVLNAVLSALEVLQKAGAVIVEFESDDLHADAAMLTIQASEASAYHQGWLRARGCDYGDDVRLLLQAGETIFATQYVQAQRYRSLLRSKALGDFAHVDVFVSPTVPFVAPLVGESRIDIDEGRSADILSAIIKFTGMPSLTGFPAITVPCGFDEEGLPIGMQVIGKPFNEGTLFRLGKVYQGLTRFHEESPMRMPSKGALQT